MRAALLLIGTALACVACKSEDKALATLVTAAGPVERQAGEGAWTTAAIGTRYHLGDAARTADGGAGLEIVGGALLAMQPHTVLRFGGTAAASKLAVELGAIELTGTGNYGFDIGDVRLSRNGTVRITSGGDGAREIELTLGEAQVSTLDGDIIDLVVGRPVDIGLEVAVTPILADAGAPDAALADAGPDAGAGEATAAIDVTGKRVEVQLPGATAWTRLAAGAGTLPAGAKLRLGAGSSAKLVARGTTLELGGGSRVAVADDLSFVLEGGDARAAATTATTLKLPGGALALAGALGAPAEARLGIARDATTRVTIGRGTAALTGGGSELAMSRGESATLSRTGTIRVLEAIPKHHDVRVAAGASVTLHDPRPPTAVQFRFGGTCPQGGVIEMDRDARFRTAKASAGKESANLLVQRGSWAYRLRCTTGSGEGAAVETGRIVVLRDEGRRALPRIPPVNTIDADGRTWRISYQSQIPNVQVNARGGGASTLHLARGGKAETFVAKQGKVVIPGSKLAEGEYTYWFDTDGKKQAKVSTLKIDFDQTAPQVYIEAPANGTPWGGDIDVRGAVLPGWSAAVGGVSIPIDRARRFAAKVQAPSAGALVIELAHPQRGVHYYLRRSNK